LLLQTDWVLAVLAVAPTSLHVIYINARCAGPLPLVLRRFPALSSISINGPQANAAAVDWQGRWGIAIASKLRHLRLDFAEPATVVEDDGYDPGSHIEYFAGTFSSAKGRALLGASRLEELDLVLCWSDDVEELCCSLPMLVKLRCAKDN
jgi:hypothetical protein